jgi:hypothetical protein
MELTLKTQMSNELKSATNKNLPAGSSVNESGPEPAVKGEPEISVGAPVPGVMAKAQTPPTPLTSWLATYAKLPVGCTAIPVGPGPAAKGEPEIGARFPPESSP